MCKVLYLTNFAVVKMNYIYSNIVHNYSYNFEVLPVNLSISNVCFFRPYLQCIFEGSTLTTYLNKYKSSSQPYTGHNAMAHKVPAMKNSEWNARGTGFVEPSDNVFWALFLSNIFQSRLQNHLYNVIWLFRDASLTTPTFSLYSLYCHICTFGWNVI